MQRPKMNYRNIDKIQSNRIAENLTKAGDNAHRRRGSGSKWYAKGDAISRMFLVEAKDKATPSKTRTISKEVFNKLREEAIYEGRIPLYVVGFGDGKDFYILEEGDFADIIGRLLNYEKRLAEAQRMIEDDEDILDIQSVLEGNLEG